MGFSAFYAAAYWQLLHLTNIGTKIMQKYRLTMQSNSKKGFKLEVLFVGKDNEAYISYLAKTEKQKSILTSYNWPLKGYRRPRLSTRESTCPSLKSFEHTSNDKDWGG